MTRRITKLSWSQINLYKNRCAYAWWLRYVEKHRPPKPQVMKFGIAVHAGAEHFLNEYYFIGQTSPEAAVANAKSHFGFTYTFDMKGSDTAKWLPVGERMVGNLVQNLLDMGDGFQPISAEQWVESKVRSGGKLAFTVVGKVDCVAKVRGEITLIDWKTAGNMKYWAHGEQHDDMQLTSYQALLMKEYDHPQLAYVITTKPDGDIHWLHTSRTDEQIHEFRRLVFQTHKEMEEATSFPKTTDPFICKWCDMRGHYCEGI